jgi:hypothetical protein
VLVRFADVEPFAAAVEESFAQLLCDGFGEVVVWLDDDILVVPRDVEGADAGDEGDAGRVSWERLEYGTKAYAAIAKGNNIGLLRRCSLNMSPMVDR